MPHGYFGERIPMLCMHIIGGKSEASSASHEFVAQVERARELSAPVSLHFRTPPSGLFAELEQRGAFGSDILVIHLQGFTAEDREILVRNGVTMSHSPVIEIPYSTVRYGHIMYDELEQLNASMSLSLDATCASANADFFNVMRGLQFAHKQRSGTVTDLTPKRLVELATIDGAKALGMNQLTGSLTPGKRADIIAVRATELNMAPMMDPYFSLVYSGLPQNVDTVLVDGRVLVREGKFTLLDSDKVREAATTAAARIEAEFVAR